jgi:hypothetical protein
MGKIKLTDYTQQSIHVNLNYYNRILLATVNPFLK